MITLQCNHQIIIKTNYHDDDNNIDSTTYYLSIIIYSKDDYDYDNYEE